MKVWLCEFSVGRNVIRSIAVLDTDYKLPSRPGWDMGIPVAACRRQVLPSGGHAQSGYIRLV